MNINELKLWIKKGESLKLKPYIDSTGKITIGWGRNIQDNGISVEEAQFMFNNDFYNAQQELQSFKWFTKQPENVQAALINMNFNLGITKLLGFKKMIAALDEGDYTNAALEALDSKWAIQIGQRAKDIALMIREGK